MTVTYSRKATQKGRVISHLSHALQTEWEKTGGGRAGGERVAAGLRRDNKIKMKRPEDGGRRKVE